MGVYPEKFEKEFIRRTKVNLEFIQTTHARDKDKKVFEVTQLINSMLGLLVFPKEAFYDLIDNQKTLDTYRQDGWEIPVPTIGNKANWNNLQQYVRHMRNGVTHRHIEFSSIDNKEVSGMTIWDTRPRSDKTIWKVNFTIKQLIKFTEKMARYFLSLEYASR